MKVGGESYATAALGAPLENRRIGLFPEEDGHAERPAIFSSWYSISYHRKERHGDHRV